jgi:hypothetical protein
MRFRKMSNLFRLVFPVYFTDLQVREQIQMPFQTSPARGYLFWASGKRFLGSLHKV